MKTNLKLVSVTEIKTENRQKDKKVNREYFTAEFVDVTNPFAIKTVKRNFFQSHNADGTKASWGPLNMSTIKSLIGKQIPGEVVNENVLPYEIEGRTATNYTTVLLPGENKKSLFKQLGHPIAEGEGMISSIVSLSEGVQETTLTK